MSSKRAASQANNWRTYIILVVALVLIGVTGTAVVVLRRTDQALTNMQTSDPRANTPNPEGNLATETSPNDQPFVPATLKQPFTMLLVGVDKRAEAVTEGVRSDTLILVRINPQGNWATMLSIPRDSVVSLPSGAFGKVNSAFSFGYYNAEKLYGAGTSEDAGGGAAAAETMERFLKINVDYIAQVDFYGFERLVDSVGGILVDVKQTLVDPEYPTENHGVERIYIAPGVQLMDGKTALVFARSRHSTNDFDRSKRQQQVLKAVLNQVRSRGLAANVSLLPNWISVLEQNVRTTLPMSDISTMTDLAGIVSRLDSSRIAQFSINPTDVRVDNVITSDIYWNESDIQVLVKKWQTGSTIPGVATLQVLNGSGQTGVAGSVSNNLAGQGFSVLSAGDNAGTATTMLYDIGDHNAEREQLVRTLGLTTAQIVVNAGRPAGAASDASMVLVLGGDYEASWTGATP
jgi:LCP family protein required for cell wall assembly